MANKNKKQSYETPIEVFRQIKSGMRDPSTIPVSLRREMIGLLLEKNYSKQQLTLFFKVNERTIRRDINERNKQAAEEFIKNPKQQYVGRLLAKAERCTNNIISAIEGPGAKGKDKISGNFAIWKIEEGLTKSLQTLGLLPNVTAATNKQFIDIFPDRTEEKPKHKKNLSPEDEENYKIIKYLLPQDRGMLITMLDRRIAGEENVDIMGFLKEKGEEYAKEDRNS